MKKLLGFLSVLFYANITFAYVTENVTGGCTEHPNGILRAVFTPNEHNCVPGYYLPANYDGCVACPSGATCGGGTFKFNATEPQGVIHAAPITQNQSNLCSERYEKLTARFQINQYTCAPGYYLPAGNDWLTDNDGCTICPENSYCAGGTYTFNETTPQGIVACASGLFAPAGMWEPAQCGRILHVGDEVVYLRATKKTLHAVHVDVDNDGVADFFGNMTTADVPMHAGTTRKLKVQFAGQTYSVYDDTVNVTE